MVVKSNIGACALAVNLMILLSYLYRIIIDNKINATVNEKNIVYVINDTDHFT